MWGANLSAMSWYKTPQESPDRHSCQKTLQTSTTKKIPDLEKMVKVTRSSSKKNEEIEELATENSETELENSDSEEEEEEESCMELSETSGDEDSIKVSNIFVIIFIHII